jgi:AcrR family transcriptional regulator
MPPKPSKTSLDVPAPAAPPPRAAPPTATPSRDTPSPAGRRARRGTLSREQILTAALRLIDAEGLDALTMRRLGQQLGHDPMALYRYTPDRAALLDGVAELVLDQLHIPPGASDWAFQLRRTAHEFRRLATSHPNVVPLLVTRPLATPLALRPLGTLRPLEDMLTLLVGAGFAPTDALHVYRAYFGFLYGHVLNELQELVVNPDETDALLRLGLHRLPINQFPQLRGVATALVDYDGAAELDRGLDILLTGLQTQLQPESPDLQAAKSTPE